MRVRRTEPGDWARLREVRLRALRDAPWAFGSTLEREAALTDEHWRERAQDAVFVAEDGDRIVGMAGGFVNGPRLVRVWGMWIDPAARGRGLAEQLVDAVDAWAFSIGATELELAVSERAGAAQAAYARMGFAMTDEREPLQEGGELYTRRMVRACGWTAPRPRSGPGGAAASA
jgi:RimJ/RimL family protein N-acetyltransferase